MFSAQSSTYQSALPQPTDPFKAELNSFTQTVIDSVERDNGIPCDQRLRFLKMDADDIRTMYFPDPCQFVRTCATKMKENGITSQQDFYRACQSKGGTVVDPNSLSVLDTEPAPIMRCTKPLFLDKPCNHWTPSVKQCQG